MCRLFSMSGGQNRIHATFWLLEAPDSLLVQSYREPDGTGLGVFDENGTPRIHRRPISAHEDAEFEREAKEVKSTTFVAHIRYASTGAVAPENTHPFEQNGRLLAHNGVIGDLDKLDAELGDYRSFVKGETDSERFFTLITKEADANGGDVTAAIAAATEWASKNIPIYALNIILTTPTELWVMRYPDTHELFVLERAAGGSHGIRHFEGASASRRMRVRSHHLALNPAVVVASERLDENPGWRLLEAGELIHVDRDLNVRSEFPVHGPPALRLQLHHLSERAAASQTA